jgi:hypothetical protein
MSNMNLPPLPEPWIVGGILHAPIDGTFTAGQMRDYATAAVQAEREAIAQMFDGWHAEDRHRHNYWTWAAREIRARKETK